MVGEAKVLLRAKARTIRAIAWLALVPVMVLNVLAWETASQLGDVARVLIVLIPPACALGGSLVAFALSRPHTTERTFWAVSSVAIGFLFAGKAYFGIYQLTVDMRGPSIPSAFDALNLCAAVSFLVLIALMLRRSSRGVVGTASGTAAVVAIATMLYAITYRWIAAPLVQASGLSPRLGAVWAAYILVGAVLCFGALGGLVRHRGVRSSGWQLLTSVALILFGLSVMLWPAWDPSQSVRAGGSTVLWLNVGYVTGYYLYFMGSVYWLTGSSSERPVMLAGELRPTARVDLVVTTVSLAALPLFAWWASTSAPHSVDRTVYFTTAAILTVAAVLKTALADLQSVSLSRLEVRDMQTGVLNRRGFDDRMVELMKASSARGAPLSLVVLDLDDFARFNVLQGRAEGDRVLQALANSLVELVPEGGVVGRLGGDEFGLLLPDVDKVGALAVARDVVASASGILSLPAAPLGLSAGVATAPEDGSTCAVLLDNADGALYWAKLQGKRQAFAFSDVVSQALEAESRIRAVHEHSRLDIVRALAAATDARDAATAYHSRQVAALSAALGEQLGLDRERINEIQTAALLHDVGKVAVPDTVLRKRSRLSPGERALLREHSELGARILDATELSYMAPWVRAHHERWDGAGYPDGLSGEEIPLEARIIGACNLYDQIVSGSPERGPLSRQAALQEIDQGIGRALDPRVGEALIDVVERSRSLGWSEAWLS